MARPLKLAAMLQALKKHYGVPESLPTKDPFELILWENVAYLAPPARRRAAFALLRQEIGLSPGRILAASRTALERVTAHGILKARFADKLRECARIAIEDYGADLGAVLREPLAAGKKSAAALSRHWRTRRRQDSVVRRRAKLLAPDSNALRVLMRVGFIAEDKSYARMYAVEPHSGRQHPRSRSLTCRQAHLLLKLHGQTLCKRNAPLCGPCPLAIRCPFAALDRQ